MIVLGLNAFGHDAAAVLLVDGEVAFASSEERFDRRRHSAAFPARAIEAALDHADIEGDRVDAIVFPWTRDMGRWHKVWHVLRRLPRSLAYLRDPPDAQLPSRRGYLAAMRGLERRLREYGLRAPLYRVPHHAAHAASAALALPDGTGAIVTADGMGEWTTAATWSARACRLRRLRHAVYPHSPGKAYAAVTQWLGFVPESDEGKTMGLAAYGDAQSPTVARLGDVLVYDAYALCRVAEPLFGFPWGESRLYGDAFVERFGPPRRPDEPLRAGDGDVALGIQTAAARWGMEAAAHACEASGANNVSLAGGLFLNCAANGHIRQHLGARGVGVTPFPVAGDAGAAWGAAAEVHRRRTGSPAAALGTLELGYDTSDGAARGVAEREGMRRIDGVDELADAVAQRIAAGRIVALARGRAEFGPRALGARSLLASPTTTACRDRVNTLKGREDWRPLAPIVRAGDDRWFEGLAASPHMILTFQATSKARREIPGVVHADGTARVQTVGEAGFLRSLLDALERRGEPPVVVNTSFNRRGEPIVNTPEQAWRSYEAMGLDALVLDRWLHDRNAR